MTGIIIDKNHSGFGNYDSLIDAKSSVLLVTPNDCLTYYKINTINQEPSSNSTRYKNLEVIKLRIILFINFFRVIFQICAENLSIVFERNETNFVLYAKTKTTKNEIVSIDYRSSKEFLNATFEIQLGRDHLILTGIDTSGTSIFSESLIIFLCGNIRIFSRWKCNLFNK